MGITTWLRTWFHPGLVITTIVGIHVGYMLMYAVPQINILYFGQDPSNWPDVVPTSKQNFETLFSIHVVSAILLVISFFRAVFTNPGSIPNNNTWREASGLQFPLKEQEQKFLALLKVPHRVASTKARKESTCFLNIPDHTAYLKNLLVTERKFLDGVEKEMTTSAMGTDNTALSDEEFVESWIQFLRNVPLISRKHPKKGEDYSGGGQLRWCKHCKLFKPDRSHHCRRCQTCVLRMDHHCPWVNNCVGFNNYKYFVLVLFYAAIAAMMVFASMFPMFTNMVNGIGERNGVMDDTQSPAVTIAIDVIKQLPFWLFMIYDGVLCLGSLFFFLYHAHLIARGMTHIELRENASSPNAILTHRFAVSYVKFDQGWFANYTHFLGPWYRMFLPVCPDPEETGLYTMMKERSCCG